MDALWQVLFPDLFIFNSCFLASYLFYFSLLLFLYNIYSLLFVCTLQCEIN